MSTLKRTVLGYVDTMAQYKNTGQKSAWGGVRILPSEITGVAVELIVPARGYSLEQISHLTQLIQTASNEGVTLRIIRLP